MPADGDGARCRPDRARRLPGRRASRDHGGKIVVTGLPTADVDETLASLVWWEVLLILLGVVAAGGVGTVVVRRQLRPLHEVAADRARRGRAAPGVRRHRPRPSGCLTASPTSAPRSARSAPR